MSRRGKRVFLFLAMVAAGLVLVLLLSDPFEKRARGVIHDIPAGAADGKLKLTDGQSGQDTLVSFPGELTLELTTDVQVEPGRIEKRPAYRVHIMSGSTDPSGSFLANQPLVHLLDKTSGAETGTLSSEQGRFEIGSAVGGTVAVDVTHMDVKHFSLLGNVQGDFPVADGPPAHLTAARLDVDNRIVTGPGLVTWTRPDMVVDGHDMTWNGDTGELLFRSDAHLKLEPTAERKGMDLFAPGGMSWTVPPGAADPRHAAFGELRGHVTGSASDGSRIAADTLLVNASNGLISLQGSSVYEREQDGKTTRLTAQHIAVQADDQGQLALAEADGDVHLVSAPIAVLPAWMIADHVAMQGDKVHSPGRVTWTRDGVTTTGQVMDWDGAVGRLNYERDAEITVDKDHPGALAGLHVRAPGGLTFTLPPEDPAPAAGAPARGAADPLARAHGEMRGRVTATLPDGSSFGTDMLFFDGPQRSFRLEGNSVVDGPQDKDPAHVDARRITLQGDDAGRLAVISAEGEVILLSGPVDVMPTRLVSQRLDKTGEDVSSPDIVTWTRGDLTVVGTGMTWNDAAGRLDFQRDAQITFVDPQSQLRLDLAAQSGLTWIMPKDALHPMQEGHGELRGRVTGKTSDGSTLDTDKLLIDGPAHTLRLEGPSTVRLADAAAPLTVTSQQILVESADIAPRVSTPEPVQWSRPGMSGHGTGLLWDKPTGHLHFDKDVQLDFDAANAASGAASVAQAVPAAQTPPRWQFRSDGSLDWTVPEGAADPLRAGRGEVHGNVRGGDGSNTLQTELLLVDGPAGTVTLRGPSSWERHTALDALSARGDTSIVVQTSPDGAPTHVQVEGNACALFGRVGAPGGLTRVAGDSLVVDKLAHEYSARGHALVERAGSQPPIAVTAADHLLMRSDAQDQPQWVEAEGGVACLSGEFEVHADTLHWDIATDRAVFSGHCQILSSGAAMTAAEVELSPRAQTFCILHSTLHVQG